MILSQTQHLSQDTQKNNLPVLQETAITLILTSWLLTNYFRNENVTTG